MNYFELHLGDYEAATAHLSMLEDAAYCRMLRIYYRTEKALPADVKQLHRLVRAVSKPERDAVQQVLADFFELRDDGWHQARCDAEIERFKAGEPEREVKRANEDNRLKRHREERAALFKTLTDAGRHAPWNIGMAELRALVKALQEPPPDTAVPPLPATAPETPATATQTPDTRHQTPDEKKDPHTPKGAKAAIGLKAWLDVVKATGQKPVPDNDPVFAYAESVKLPHDFLRLAWLEFRHRYTQPEAKRYRDWRAVFRKAVRGNWLKLWFLDPASQQYGLTTVGEQAKRAHAERTAA